MSDLEADVDSNISYSSDEDEVLILGNPRIKNSNFFGN